MTPLTAEAATLAQLSKWGYATVPRIAEVSGRTRSGIAAAMLRLFADELVRIRSAPKRRNGRAPDIWELTAKGHKLHARHRAAVAEAYELER